MGEGSEDKTVNERPPVSLERERARRVTPNPDAPKVASPKRAELIAQADAQSAEGYDALEDAAARARELATALEGGTVVVDVPNAPKAT